MGDMNAKIGSNIEGSEHDMFRHGIGNMNEMVNYLVSYVLVVT